MKDKTKISLIERVWAEELLLDLLEAVPVEER